MENERKVIVGVQVSCVLAMRKLAVSSHIVYEGVHGGGSRYTGDGHTIWARIAGCA